MPLLGPLASHLISFAIFIQLEARPFKAPLVYTMASLLVRAWNLFESGTKGRCVFSEMIFVTTSSKPSGQLIPVPTAVAPQASSYTYFKLSII